MRESGGSAPCPLLRAGFFVLVVGLIIFEPALVLFLLG